MTFLTTQPSWMAILFSMCLIFNLPLRLLKLFLCINLYQLGIKKFTQINFTQYQYMYCHTNLLFILLLLLKKVSSARVGESDIHPISPKTPTPQYQPIDRKKRKRKRVEDYSRDRAAQANKEALAQLLKPASPTPSKTELTRSFQRDTEKGIKVLLYCKVLQRGCA